MKKLIAVLAVICVLFVGAVGYMTYKDKPAEVQSSAEPAVSPEESQPITAEESAAPIEVLTVDYDALYASHEPDEVVAQINGKDVCWDEYFYWLYYNCAQAENYIGTMANYGLAISWDDALEEGSDQSIAEYVVASTGEQIKQMHSIEEFAEENNIVLDEEALAAIEEQVQSTIASVCGEDATEEDFEEYLAQAYMTRELYDRMNRINTLYQQGYIQLYGETGERVTDETALKYLEDNGYLSANHILFMTIDSTTGDALDDETVAAQEAKAKELAAELQAITDPKELLDRFAELKEEYCEDTGKTTYPDGYTFTSGTMVTEFEDACNALEEYQVSDPVLSSYGYHVIVRLPLSPDSVVQYSSSGTPLTGRTLAANMEYGSRLDAQYEKAEFELIPGFSVNLKDYLK